ncbi:CBS domain-containing protein [Roseimicrobium gellanilyticum]|uniref:CBS domain-containing protein n=1 Tax=Roseimicrobium gellanilyticum TaxID=748857 RepID=A0A366HWJ2_9BACT|nr:CBS domain-containing protein [Roseimicrobium gellanilyticum]RBP47944.1 CBS domain-containing protein [Roseimicrobium gellanilyticum]
MKLSEFLSRNLKLLSPEDSVQTAGSQMRKHGASNMPVASERKLVGMLDQPNPDLQATRYGHDPKKVTVGETMSENAVCCLEDQDLASALRVMNDHHLDFLPIVDKQHCVLGVVHRDELVELAATQGDSGF